MDYVDLLGRLSPADLRQLAASRGIRCTYLDHGDISDSMDLVVKTFAGQLEQPDNIERALLSLSAEQVQALKQMIQGKTVAPDQVASLRPYGLFLETETGVPVFQEGLADIIRDWETVELPENEADTRPAFLAYGAYIAMVNALTMRRVRCLVNMKPGRRMLDCIRERLPIAGADYAWGYLYDFLVSTDLLLFDDTSGRLKPGQVLDRDAFYTNLYRYVFSQEGGDRLAMLLGVGSRQGARVHRRRLVEDGVDVTWLAALDLVRSMDDDAVVITDLARQFLSRDDRSVSLSMTGMDAAYVLPGFRIMAEPLLPIHALRTLVTMAELERYDQVFQFALTTCSLIQARKAGMDVAAIIQAVRDITGDCPDDMARLIEDTLDRYGEIRIFSGYPVVVGRDTVRTEQALQQEEIARYVRYRTDQVLILDSEKDPVDIKRALVEAELIPELDRDRSFRRIHLADMKEIAALLGMLKEHYRKDGGEIPDRVDALLTALHLTPPPLSTAGGSPSVEPAMVTVSAGDSGTMSLEDRMELLQFAMSRKYRVRVRYKQKGTETMEERIIQPKYFDGDFLVAYCESRAADRRFNVYRLAITGLIVEDRV